MVWVLVPPDNLGQNKHVESADVPCLDEGSNPSISTNKTFIEQEESSPLAAFFVDEAKEGESTKENLKPWLYQ